MYSAPTAAWVSATSRKNASVSAHFSGLCRMPHPVPATTVNPYSSITDLSSLASFGK